MQNVVITFYRIYEYITIIDKKKAVEICKF